MLGGTPRCERCGQAVYHAEQVMGPGRKIYHKLCLKCDNCGKRLDQGSLVQHDNQPYCSRCHTQLFGTRDLRHANHLPTSPTPREPPPRKSADLGDIPAPRIAPRPVAPPADYYTPPTLDDLEAPGSRSVGAGFQRGGPAAPPPVPTTPERDTEVTRVNFRSPRPIPSGVSQAGTGSPRAKVGAKPGFEDRCRGCEKRVYAAEQVFAIGHKWHRGCLRCTSCKSTIDPSKVSDRDGAPWCKNCYAREHGPAGIARAG